MRSCIMTQKCILVFNSKICRLCLPLLASVVKQTKSKHSVIKNTIFIFLEKMLPQLQKTIRIYKNSFSENLNKQVYLFFNKTQVTNITLNSYSF